MQERIALIIPTYQAARHWPRLWASICRQSLQPVVWVIDSSSNDGTAELVQSTPVHWQVIPKAEFNHGATRQLALSLVDADIVIYLTQDAILAGPEALATLVKAFADPKVGCAYGRQLPHQGAGVLGAHLRHFNYPEHSEVRSLADVPRLGLRACANSNSFAAYRRSALTAAGGFPAQVILGEDVVVAAKMILAGWSVAYCAEACVYHSHDYTALQDLRRYFDIGVFHQQEHWLLEQFKSPGQLGARYVQSELAWCWACRRYAMMIMSIVHCGCKWIGYRLGRRYAILPVGLRRWLSMHPFFWTMP